MPADKMVIYGSQQDDNGRKWQIGVPLADLTTHTFIVGTTGSGKSTLLGNLAVQTFGLGASTAILEPHGDLCQDVLAALPDNDQARLVYLSLDSSQPPAIPLMTVGLAGGVDVGMNAVLSVIRMAEPASWDQSTRMREVLRHAVRCILDAQGWQASIIALDRFLSNGETAFRERILAGVSEEAAKSRDYCRDELFPALDGQKGGASLRDSVLAAQRRIEVFTTDRRLRRTLALPPLGPRINLGELLTGGRLVLVPANSAELGEKAAALVKMLFMQMVKTAFLSRTDRNLREQAVIIIDEFAAMAGGDEGGSEVAEITNTLLAEARKFGAAMILATQSADQLDPRVKKLVQINTNHKVILLVSEPGEAKTAADILGSDQVNDADIRNLPRFHGYLKAMVNKAPQPACLLEMLAPIKLAGRFEASEALEVVSPQTSTTWKRVRDLAAPAADPLYPERAQEVVNFLRGLGKDDWREAVQDAGAWNKYQAARLFNQPNLVPDRRKRAMMISRCLYGLPWWLREAFYWRTLQAGKGSPGRPKLEEVASEANLLSETAAIDPWG